MDNTIIINLLDDKGNVQYGLNWGNRIDRDPNEAYLNLSKEVYESNFFPTKGNYFIAETDDNDTLIFNRAQKDEKGHALQTPESNAKLGKYLRKRLGLPVDSPITKESIEKYGRSTISVTKIDSKHYYFNFSDKKDRERKENSSLQFIPKFSQIIYYGVPGSGKSHQINEKIKNDIENKRISDKEKQVVRVVFHPEYTNADFIGQILPTTNANGNIEYTFTPGPFARILCRAYLNQDKPYYLIIEEINRGNAAAIFGEIFQLLDRHNKEESDIVSGNVYGEGWSLYSVDNDFINWYIRQSFFSENERNGIATENSSSIDIGSLHFSENTGIRLPPNLSLFATMNTSDQNVFTLDNAFQRRWDMKLIENKFSDTQEDMKQRNAKIQGSEITWETFQMAINRIIGEIANTASLSSVEDKRIGCWFVKAEADSGKDDTGYIISQENFKNKILKYLWDDAFKFSREVFMEVNSFEELLRNVKFEDAGFGIFKDITFKNESNYTDNNANASGPIQLLSGLED